MTSAGQAIKKLITQMMEGAKIDSAARLDTGWINRVLTIESDPGLVKAIDDELGGSQGFGKEPAKLRSKEQMEKRFRDFMKSTETKAVTGAIGGGGLMSLLAKEVGVSQARSAMMMLRDPKRMIAKTVMSKRFLRGTTILGQGTTGFGNLTPSSMIKAGGILALIWLILNSRPFIEAITKQMTKRGGIFDKTFRNKTNTLQNQFRTREQQQSIRSGFTQVIFTTNAGTVDPRNSYNTYEQTVNNEVALANLRNIRTVGNVVP